MITIKMDQNQITQLRLDYKGADFRTDIQYTYFQIKEPGVSITAYTSGKVVFAGKDALLHASRYQTDIASKTLSKTQVSFPMSGSDEVGTGDYFGPVTVAACYVSEANLKEIPVDLITDTKAMKDNVIIEIAPLLMEKLDHSLLILGNKKYNRIQATNNLNEIKAKMHNQAFLHLAKKVDLTNSSNIIDQFVNERKYFDYLKNEPEVFRNLKFETKAEHQYIAVACGAIISRYAFLYYFMDMEKKYDFNFPKGSGKHVTKAAQDFVDKYGFEALNDVAKIHFKITQDLK